MKKNYHKIVKHYEDCLKQHGDNHLGVDWPTLEDADIRYKVMLDIIRANEDVRRNISLLDFGCGTAHLLEYIQRNDYGKIHYSGLDISKRFIDVAKRKFPDHKFYCMDILDSFNKLGSYDYFIMNGVFTEKRELTFKEMWEYFTEMLEVIFNRCNNGVAFNVMSKNVDWERDDLFHLSKDKLSEYICNTLTRNFIIRNDYGLYEYTVYVLKP